MVVCGVDKRHSRTIVYKSPRTLHTEGADEAFFLTQLYTAERAIAMSEFRQNQRGDCCDEPSRDDKLCVIFNFRDYSSRNSPSKSILVSLIKVLQTCYPERLGVLLVLDPPFWMRALFNLVWPFLSRATAEKIDLSGDTLSELLEGASEGEKLHDMIHRSKAAPIDLDEYTQKPFYCIDT
jgi:hypothetical protein